MSARCPTCKQSLPPVDGWKVNARELRTGYHHRGSLAWWPDNEEGLAVGQARASVARLDKAVTKWLASRSDDLAAAVDVLVVDLAAAEIAASTGGEKMDSGAFAWDRNPPRAMIVHRANEIATAAVKRAHGGAK